ncbi:MAG: S8 family serine peptidase [candidate division Zixibacteria bacterium]
MKHWKPKGKLVKKFKFSPWILVVTTLLCMILVTSLGWTQDSTRFDLRVKLKGFTFDPLDSIPTIPRELRLELPAMGPSYQIIQFKRPLTRQQVEMLKEKFGLKMDQYISGFAYLEKIEAATIDSLKKTEFFRWNGPYHPAYRISPSIGTLEFRTPERRAMTDLMLRAKLFDDADTTAVKTAIQGLGGHDIVIMDDRAINGPIRINFQLPSPDDLLQIAIIPGVRWIEEVPESFLDNGNTAGTLQSGTPGTTPIWDHDIHGEGQIIGIMDTRVDIAHCMFDDPTDNTVRPDHRKVVGYHTSITTSGATHGTFVAGIALGDDSNNSATGANRGNAWAARLTYDESGGGGSPTVLARLYGARNDGARIHTNSWHDEPTPQYDQTAEDVDRFIWDNEDHVVLGSAGNVGEDIGPPGTAKNAICVGASDVDPNEMNFGDGNPGPTPAPDGRRKPDLFAPGCAITSAQNGTNCTITIAQNIYGWPTPICATSWSTPAAAACAALVRQYYTEGWYPSGTKQPHHAFTPSGALIKATLLNSTINMIGIAGYPSDDEGWGLIRLENSVYFDGDNRNVWVWDVRNNIGLYTGESHNYTIEVVNNITPLKVTLVWTEPPASSGSANPNVNDLNLTIIDPTGITYLGNDFAAGQSTTGGTADDVNNVEQVLLTNPPVGEYTIQIDAPTVNQGNPGQGYALVASADTPEPPIPTGDQNTLVVRVALSDIMAGAAPPLTTVQNIMTNVENYIEDISYDVVDIQPDYTEVSLSQPSTHYYHPSRNVLIEMTQDVIDELIAADPNTFDKGTAATNDDIDRLIIVLNDQNFTDDYATTGPWPYDLPGGLTRRISVSVNSIYNDPDERFMHALGHHFGLIDLYPHPGVTFSTPHVDEWDNMAFPINGSDCMAWNKERATWITSQGSDIEYVPRPASGGETHRTIGINYVSGQDVNGQDIKAIAIGMTEGATTIEDEDVFYFVEARSTHVGNPDEILPAEGVLIYYVNENIRQGEGPVIIRDNEPGTTTLTDAELAIGESYTVTGRGLIITVNNGTGGADRNIDIDYDPPETDNDVSITVGDPSYTSPDIWIDSQKDGFDEDNGRTPVDRGDNPVTGETNRIYYRIHNPGPGDAYDFYLYAKVSEPYHTAGGSADFNVDVDEVYFPQFATGSTPIVDYVEWTPAADYDPSTGKIKAHSCVEVTIPNVFNDVNTNNNRAQQNLNEVPSTQASPYESVTYRFNFTNPEDTRELFYFRVEGVPNGWTSVLTPKKAHLNGKERISCILQITPPIDAPVCTEHRFEVTSWMVRGHTLIPVGGGTAQVDLRNRTEITLGAQTQECNYKILKSLAAVVHDPVGRDTCEIINIQGCTNPPRPYEEIIIRYEDPSGYPIYRTVVTDEFGCYSDFYVVAQGGSWGVSAEYPGSDCDGPALAYVDDIQISLPRTYDQDNDGRRDEDEVQGDINGNGILCIYDPDCDGDGILDGNEPLGDIDNDGHRNDADKDADGDGIIDGDDPEPWGPILFKKISLSLHTGTAVPTGGFANAYDPGINFMLDAGYWFTPQIAVMGFVGKNDFKAKSALYDDNYIINISVNGRYYQPYRLLPMPPWSYYIGGGLGYYLPDIGDNEFGFNVGAGLNHEVNRMITLEIGVDYHQTFDDNIKFIHAHGGVIVRF